MKTIVALVDLTEASSKVIQHAQVLAEALGSEVVLMHVTAPVPSIAPLGGEIPSMMHDPTPEIFQAGQARLKELLEPLTNRGVKARALQFKGPVEDTVLKETEQLNADLVVMGSHHHGTFYQLFIGSVTSDVLKHASFPVLVVPCDVPAPKQAG